MPRTDIYVCEKCGKKVEKIYKSIEDERLEEIDCDDEKCDGKAKYNYRETMLGARSYVPLHHKADYSGNGGMNYDGV